MTDNPANEAFQFLKENGLAWANANPNNLTFHLWDTKQTPKDITGFQFIKPVCGRDSGVAPIGGMDWLIKLVVRSERQDYKRHNVCGLCERRLQISEESPNALR